MQSDDDVPRVELVGAVFLIFEIGGIYLRQANIIRKILISVSSEME